MTDGRIRTFEHVNAYTFAGHATFTLRSAKTGTRFTYQVQQKEPDEADRGPPLFFVRVLTGPENTSDYTYLGLIRLREGEAFYYADKKRRISPDAPSAKAFAFLLHCLQADNLPEALEFYHDGRCAACGRALTDPESILTGFGPTCSARRGITRITCDIPEAA
jgi:hypothetical protein